jgi:hypothetical protein
MPNRIFRFSSKQGPNTPNCRKQLMPNRGWSILPVTIRKA